MAKGKMKIVLEVEYDTGDDTPAEAVIEEISEPYDKNGQIRMDCQNIPIIECSLLEIEEI